MSRKNRNTPATTEVAQSPTIGNTPMSDEQNKDVVESAPAAETPVITETVSETVSELPVVDESSVEANEGSAAAAAEVPQAEIPAAETPAPTLETETPVAAVVVETPATTEVVSEAPVATAVASNGVDSSVPIYLRIQRDRLAQYGAKMNVALRLEPKDILDQQNLFRMTIFALLRLRGAEFVTALDEVLVFINANRAKAFHEKYAFREYQNLNISKEERRLLIDVVHLLINISNPDTRRLVLSQIDLPAALRGCPGYDEVFELFREFITK